MTRYTVRRRPAESERRRVCAWLEQHGIDPYDVVERTGWIETHPVARRIAYLGFVWETVDGKRLPKLNATRDDAEYAVKTVQLESPPMPFPPGITCVEAS